MGRLAIIRQLAEAGYGNEAVLAALLENGMGTWDSLSTLRASGWSDEEVVKALVGRGELASEVRHHLDRLEIPRAIQRKLLLRHCPASVVDLVLRPNSLRLAANHDGEQD